MSSLGAKIDELRALRLKRQALNKESDDVGKEITDLERELIAQMDAQGVEKATGKTATVAIHPDEVAGVENWDKFYKFIHRHKYYHLLQKRVSSSACMEIVKLKGKVPGVVPFTQRKLSVTAVNH